MGLSLKITWEVQLVQNAATQGVMGTPKYAHTFAVWTALLTDKLLGAIQGAGTIFLPLFLPIEYNSVATTEVMSSEGSQAFSIIEPALWNIIFLEVWVAPILSSVK